jgi:FixJ family two-component response regulator
MKDAKPTVFVVDDDISVCGSLRLLIESAGWQPETFGSAREFLARTRIPVPSCLLLDAVLPDISGCELQNLLVGKTDLPIIFISGHDDLPMTIQAMKAGAMDFFIKPFVNEMLVSAMREALDRSRAALSIAEHLRALRDNYASLSPRQREVMALVVGGRLNKQVGGELGISEITVKVHRGNVMRKMKADSLPDLVRMADRLAITPFAKC